MKRLSTFSPLFFSFLLLGACGDSDTSNNNDTENNTNTPTDAITLKFSAQVDGKAADCNSDYTLGMSTTKAKLADARFFISSVQYRTSDGDWVDMKLTENDWQHKNVSLLDFENATGACKDSGTPETHKLIEGTIATGDYDKVRFSLGVPFELNHIDNATAPAPLNTPGMFWVWQGGYKFLRVDWLVEGSVLPRFNTHLGATHCVSDNPTAPPEERCGNPNMATFEFDISAHKSNEINLDLKKMFSKTDLSVNVMDTPPGCQSSPMEPSDCQEIFTSLGMTFADGKCEGDCSNQTTFSLIEP